MTIRCPRIGVVVVAAVACVSFGTNARATTVAPPPCAGALPLYTRIGTLSNVDGSHRRKADIEARLAILREASSPSAGGRRVGWAYVDEEGDVWVVFDRSEYRAAEDWRHVAPGNRVRAPVYALLERVGMPHGYRFTACSS